MVRGSMGGMSSMPGPGPGPGQGSGQYVAANMLANLAYPPLMMPPNLNSQFLQQSLQGLQRCQFSACAGCLLAAPLTTPTLTFLFFFTFPLHVTFLTRHFHSHHTLDTYNNSVLKFIGQMSNDGFNKCIGIPP